LALLRIHNRKNAVTLITSSECGEETIFIDKGKYKDVNSSEMSEDVYNKWQYGMIKVEMLKKHLGEPVI
jgi:ribosomal protein L19E